MSDVQLQVELVTLFPEMFDSFLGASLLGKAIAGGLIAVERTNPRDFVVAPPSSPGRGYRSVDDTPYGGGPGMILRPGPLADAIDHLEARRGRAFRVFLSPSGTLLSQAVVGALVERRRVLFVCGRYEGYDDRVASLYADLVLSVGDYVLAGGEVAAALIIEAMARLVPGVLGCSDSSVDESFSAGRLEYPQYTRPPEFRGLPVPEILLSGDHGAVARWRRLEALRRTVSQRPDLLDRHPLSAEERELLHEQKPDKG
jgi:tRNA (guanine37-N1)-methyltransferase